MSRTLKDRPNYMRELDNFRKGKIEHDHTPRIAWRGNGEYQRSTIWSAYGTWKREFMVHEMPALREFKATLEADGYEYDEEVVFKDTRPEKGAIFGFGNYRDAERRFRETVVVTPYRLKRNEFRHTTEFCSAEHLALGPGKYRWWVDTRDGLLANCTPVSDYRGSVPKRVKEARVTPRSNVNQAMREVAKDFNSGVLEEDFDSEELYVNKRRFGRDCPCCW